MPQPLVDGARRLLANLALRTPAVRGKTRVLRRADALLRSLDGSPMLWQAGQVRYELRTEDLIDFSLLYAGAYQSGMGRYLTGRLRGAERVMWDVGANVGSVCLPVAAACPGLTVHAFEPSPTVSARLTRNLALNAALTGRVIPHRLALSDRAGEADFFVSNERHNSGVGGLSPAPNRAQASTRVETVRGDDLIAAGRAPRPDLIKIDVEGFEHAVLSGLSALLADTEPLEVIFEHSLYRLDGAGDKARSTNADLMRDHGFELSVLDDTHAQARPLTEADLQQDCDIIARRA